MKKKFSIRTTMIFIMVVFIVSVLGLIYFFQTALLDGFYKNNKINSIEMIAHNISSNLSNNELEDILNNQTISNEVCVRIVSDSINVVGYTENNACALGRLNEYQIERIRKEVELTSSGRLFENFIFEMFPGNKQDIYIYGEIGDINGEDALVLVASSIVPLDATTRTISDQYKLIALIVVVATIILAVVISKFIVAPIKQIENESKNLPNGKYDETKVESSSKEYESLNTTLANANKEIKKADKAKKELIANVSHDLRTPLTMIVGYAEMMKEIPEENNETNIDVIIEEAKRLSTLVDDLLDVSRVENGKIVLNKKEVSVNELLEDVYKQYASYCKQLSIDFRLETIEDKKVIIDEKRITQILYNFINNSINYNNKESKQLILGVQHINDIYRIYVYDNGEGIDEKDLDKIWDRYFKVDKEHKRSHLGSGIGLSLCRDLLKAHDLNYGVESKVNEYTKFYFDLKV